MGPPSVTTLSLREARPLSRGNRGRSASCDGQGGSLMLDTRPGKQLLLVPLAIGQGMKNNTLLRSTGNGDQAGHHDWANEETRNSLALTR